VAAFLGRLKEAGICPAQVITDGSPLYPAVLAEIWPTAAHQLCLFHETRHVTDAVAAVVSLARRAIPTPPPRPRQGRGGPVSPRPPTRHHHDPATQQWHLRRARRHAELTDVHNLARQGYSQYAIARHTGRDRRTIRSWLAQEIPPLPPETQEIAAQVAAGGDDTVLRRRRWTPERQARLQELAREGLSHAAIARITGLHRVTVARWLKAAPPASVSPATHDACEPDGRAALENTRSVEDHTTVGALATEDAVALPPAPWTSWEQVWHVREALKEHRWLLLRRPDHLTTEQQRTVNALVSGPVGDLVGVARRFLLDWYALWRTEEGQRRPLAEAQERYERWRRDPSYQALPPLQKAQDLMTPTRFARLSQFLRHAQWEATNNGAERAGRAFRHRQVPHYRLRTERAIADSLRVVTCHAKERATSPPAPLPRLCPRGRAPRPAGLATQVA